VQEAAGAQVKAEFPPMREGDFLDADLVQSLHRAGGLAHGRAKRCEIVMPDQMRGARPHRLGVQRVQDLPHQPAFVGHRRSTLDQPEQIAPLLR
jgi:hypothetical protein